MFQRRDGLLFGCLLVLDQASKWIAELNLVFYQPVKIIPSVLSFELVHNYGAAYGILQQQRLFLLVVGIGIIAGVYYFRSQLIQSVYSRYALIFLLAGACGNVIDRLLLGYVIDFIDIRIFPVFNVADVCIDIAVGLFIVEMWVLRKQKKIAPDD